MESSGLRAILKELKPEHFEDIIALVALYRPGPWEAEWSRTLLPASMAKGK